eukprot:CAMPEP_0178497586 /NCGR_PEP_ID=MMETSP0696-20121128/14771_1 /TAXON_ID=265572 /ORGANISM="Extubocellulus spinifer, Strain CCMP396" /LENGTH=270 /DNA_ID=CAMNT_0020126029 /DNA_START=208 /DNA_END=1018 /DNA_ORIENTATION=-
MKLHLLFSSPSESSRPAHSSKAEDSSIVFASAPPPLRYYAYIYPTRSTGKTATASRRKEGKNAGGEVENPKKRRDYVPSLDEDEERTFASTDAVCDGNAPIPAGDDHKCSVMPHQGLLGAAAAFQTGAPSAAAAAAVDSLTVQPPPAAAAPPAGPLVVVKRERDAGGEVENPKKRRDYVPSLDEDEERTFASTDAVCDGNAPIPAGDDHKCSVMPHQGLLGAAAAFQTGAPSAAAAAAVDSLTVQPPPAAAAPPAGPLVVVKRERDAGGE